MNFVITSDLSSTFFSLNFKIENVSKFMLKSRISHRLCQSSKGFKLDRTIGTNFELHGEMPFNHR